MRKRAIFVALLLVFMLFSLTKSDTKIVKADNFPYIDNEKIYKFDDFNMEQKILDAQIESEANKKVSNRIDVLYRIAIENEENVTITNENLIFIGESHYEEKIKKVVSGKYLVLKINTNESDKIDLSLDGENFVNTADMFTTEEITLLGDKLMTYTEEDSGYYYMVIDIVKSGLSDEAKTDKLAIKYSGSTETRIDEIFLCDAINYIKKDKTSVKRTYTVTNSTNEYAFASFNMQFTNSKFDKMSMTVTKHEDNLDLSGLVMTVNDVDYFADAEKSKNIVLDSGKFIFGDEYSMELIFNLKEMEIIEGGLFEFYIDSVESGKFDIKDIEFYNSVSDEFYYSGKIPLNSIKVENHTQVEEEKTLVLQTNINFSPLYNTLALDITGDNIEGRNIIFEDRSGEFNIVLYDGKSLGEVSINKCKTLFIDLGNSNLYNHSGMIQIYYQGITDSLTIKNATLGNMNNIYSVIEKDFPEYEKIDTTPPVIKIYNEPDVIISTEMYELIVDYDPDYNMDNDVVSVEIILTNSENVSTYGNANYKKFMVRKGMYILTVKATDSSGNVGETSMYITILEEEKEQPPENNEEESGGGQTDNNQEENNNNDGNEIPKPIEKKINTAIIKGIIKFALIGIGATALAGGVIVGIIFLYRRFGKSSNKISFK